MNLKELGTKAIEGLKSVIGKLIKNTAIPKAKAGIYEMLEKVVELSVNGIDELISKFMAEPDAKKKEAHKLGLDLAAKCFDVVIDILTKVNKKIAEVIE